MLSTTNETLPFLAKRPFRQMGEWSRIKYWRTHESILFAIHETVVIHRCRVGAGENAVQSSPRSKMLLSVYHDLKRIERPNVFVTARANPTWRDCLPACRPTGKRYGFLLLGEDPLGYARKLFARSKPTLQRSTLTCGREERFSIAVSLLPRACIIHDNK